QTIQLPRRNVGEVIGAMVRGADDRILDGGPGAAFESTLGPVPRYRNTLTFLAPGGTRRVTAAAVEVVRGGVDALPTAQLGARRAHAVASFAVQPRVAVVVTAATMSFGCV